MMDHLNEGGHMFIAVPSDLKDAGGKMQKLPPGSEYHWVFFKTQQALENFLEDAGLKILSIKHIYPKIKGRQMVIGEWQVICQKVSI